MNRQLRMTHQREIILEELQTNRVHPSADELYERVKKRLPRISLATVYRNLEILSEAGLVKKLEITGRQKRFDWNVDNHHHMVCVNCARIEDISPLIGPSSADLSAIEQTGYQLTGWRIEFFGLCPQCQVQQNASEQKPMNDSPKPEQHINQEQHNILAALAKEQNHCASKAIAAATGLDSKQLSSQLSWLKKKGYVSSPVRCAYAITDEGRKLVG